MQGVLRIAGPGLLSLIVLFAPNVQAQSETTPAPAEPAAGIQPPDDALRNGGRTAPMTEQGFVKAAALAALTETELSRLALERSNNLRVNVLAGRIVKDQHQIVLDLRSLASKQGMDVPERLDVEHQALVSTLRLQSSEKFDAAYVAQVQQVRNKNTALLEQARNSASLSDPLRKFAEQSLQILRSSQDQLRHAGSITTSSNVAGATAE